MHSCVCNKGVVMKNFKKEHNAMGTPGVSLVAFFSIVLGLGVVALLGLWLYPSPIKTEPESVLMKALPRAGSTGNQTGVASIKPAADKTTASQTASIKSACAHCAKVLAVIAVEREGASTGLGVVAGGVLSAWVGNQVGGGSGRTATTVLGAVGGGWAGNEAEKKMKKYTVYRIQMRMDDGSTRTMEQMSSVAVGEKVVIEGHALRRNDGSLSTPMPAQPGIQPVAPSTQTDAG